MQSKLANPVRPGSCDGEYPTSPYRWRYLNSGLVIGRGHSWKRMLRESVPDVISGGDQAWYQRYFMEHMDERYLDKECFLLCALWGFDSKKGARKEFGAELHDKRVHTRDEHTSAPTFCQRRTLDTLVQWQSDEYDSKGLPQVVSECIAFVARALVGGCRIRKHPRHRILFRVRLLGRYARILVRSMYSLSVNTWRMSLFSVAKRILQLVDASSGSWNGSHTLAGVEMVTEVAATKAACLADRRILAGASALAAPFAT